MKELVDFIKNNYSQEEVAELVKELSPKKTVNENSIPNVPRSWEEHCNNTKQGYYITTDSEIRFIQYYAAIKNLEESKNLLPTKELAEAFLALMQLISLRQSWIKDWEPNWELEGASEDKFCIVLIENSPKVDRFWSCNKTLSFPTNEMAKDFLECFRELIEKAKVLI